MSHAAEYDDGLDADGYPTEAGGGFRYVHGAEDDIFPGDVPMENVGAAFDAQCMPGLELAAAVSRYTESPIETMLAVAILRQWPDVEMRMDGFGKGWTLIPQYVWGSFRVDFALRKPNGFLIFIECDGREFHSSPEQVERDAARERVMVDAGYPVVRFTGAEINHSAVACASMLRRYRRWGE